MGHCDNRELPEMGVDDDWLWISVGNDSDSGGSDELRKLMLEFGAEIGTFQTVDRAAEALFGRVVGGHTSATCAKM